MKYKDEIMDGVLTENMSTTIIVFIFLLQKVGIIYLP